MRGDVKFYSRTGQELGVMASTPPEMELEDKFVTKKEVIEEKIGEDELIIGIQFGII